MNNGHYTDSFFTFISKSKDNRILLLAAISACLLQWVVFKLYYPYPDFFSDSYSYIAAAGNNLSINIWPIGYSKFLALFHWFSHSDTALVTFQYAVLEVACGYFYFSVLYWTRPAASVKVVLFIVAFCNPVFLYIANYISSDALFFALTGIWFVELLWVLLEPSRARIWVQTLCVAVAFTFRYNAMYYPVITLLAYLLSRQRRWQKVFGSVAVVPFLLLFWLFCRHAGRELTGKPISSILSGWQLANNALYMRGFIEVNSANLPSPASRQIDSIASRYFQQQGPALSVILDENPGNFFIQHWHAPLKVFMMNKYKDGSIRSWAEVSPAFAEYGTYLIRTHPKAYAEYYLLPNIKHYFLPSMEKLAIYNLGEDTVRQPARVWFDYKSNRLRVASHEFQGPFLAGYTYLFMLANAFFLLSAIWLFAAAFRNLPAPIKTLLILSSTFWILNFGFSVFANIIVFRYELFPMTLYLGVFVTLYGYLDLKPDATKLQKSKNIIPDRLQMISGAE